MVRQQLTGLRILMKRRMAISRLYMRPDDMVLGLKSCVGVSLMELVRILQYKWETIFRQEWFWRMEELTKRNDKGVWMREIEKALRIFGASILWPTERMGLRDDEMDKIRVDRKTEELENDHMHGAKRLKSIEEVLEEARCSLTPTSSTSFTSRRARFFRGVFWRIRARSRC